MHRAPRYKIDQQSHSLVPWSVSAPPPVWRLVRHWASLTIVTVISLTVVFGGLALSGY